MNRIFHLVSIVLLVTSHICDAQKSHRVRSFDGAKEWKIVASVNADVGILQYLYLFGIGPDQKAAVDSFYFGNNGGTFAFDTLNKGHVIKIQCESAPTGGYGKHFFILGIVDGQFQILFRTELAMLDANESDRPIRTLSKLQFKDVNHDGYLDIVEETREDLLDPKNNFNVFEKGALEAARAIRRLSTRVQNYYWNQPSLTFEKRLIK